MCGKRECGAEEARGTAGEAVKGKVQVKGKVKVQREKHQIKGAAQTQEGQTAAAGEEAGDQGKASGDWCAGST